MHAPSAIVVVATLALSACAAETKNVGNKTVVTAAEVRASPPPSALVVKPEPPIDVTAPLALWRGRYPQAALVLDDWVAHYPDAAPRLMQWAVEEPDNFEVLVMWAVTAPHESVRTFLVTHSSWRSLAAIQREHPLAVDDFTHWIRSARAAAEEIAIRPGGLAVVASTNASGR